LAFILDAHSRRIVGWLMASHLRAELVVEALEMGLWRRKPAAGLIHHSDQGVQYTSLSFRQEIGGGRCGALYGESSRLRRRQCPGRELRLHVKGGVDPAHRWATKEEARTAIFEYLEVFYNRRRLHSALGYESPADYEEATMEGEAVA